MNSNTPLTKSEFDQGYDNGFDSGFNAGFNRGFTTGYEHAVNNDWELAIDSVLPSQGAEKRIDEQQ
jgi:hypothetical protein